MFYELNVFKTLIKEEKKVVWISTMQEELYFSKGKEVDRKLTHFIIAPLRWAKHFFTICCSEILLLSHASYSNIARAYKTPFLYQY